MRPVEPLPPSIVRRAAAIARGPHACPSCECPTWTEPPVPWTDLRGYIVRCDACERPIAVRIDRDRVLRRGRAPREAMRGPGMFDPVAELLDRRDRRAFAARVVTAMPAPLALVAMLAALGAGPVLVGIATVAGIAIGSCWGPALFAAAWGILLESASGAVRAVREHRHQPTDVVEIESGRWDQWMREERRRERERAERPEAVLIELERVLDERELRRVRALAERGEVPPEALEDLLRFRRSWSEPTVA